MQKQFDYSKLIGLRRSLADDFGGAVFSTKTKPQTDTECLVANVWSHILQGTPMMTTSNRVDEPQIGKQPNLNYFVEDNFFQLGGDSLAALRVLRTLAAHYGKQVCSDSSDSSDNSSVRSSIATPDELM